MGRRGRALARLLAAALPPAAERVLRRVKAVEPADMVVAAGVAPNGEPAGVGRMAPVRSCGRCCAWRAGRARELPGPTALRRAGLPSALVRNPDRRRRPRWTSRSPTSRRSPPLLRRAERAGTALPPDAKPVWVTELTGKARPRRARRARPPAGAWISRALHRLWVAGVGFVDWQFLVDPYPGVRAEHADGRRYRIPAAAGFYSAGVGGDPDERPSQAVPAGFHLPVRPSAGGPRARAHVGAADALRSVCVLQRRADAAARCGGRSLVCTPIAAACSTRWSRSAAPRACAWERGADQRVYAPVPARRL